MFHESQRCALYVACCMRRYVVRCELHGLLRDRQPQKAQLACATRSFAAYGNIATAWQRGAQQVAARCSMLQHGSTTCFNHAAQPPLPHAWRVRSEVSRCVRRIVRLVQELRLHHCRLARAQEAGISLQNTVSTTVDGGPTAATDKRRFTLAGQRGRVPERAGRRDLDGTGRIPQHALLVAGRGR